MVGPIFNCAVLGLLLACYLIVNSGWSMPPTVVRLNSGTEPMRCMLRCSRSLGHTRGAVARNIGQRRAQSSFCRATPRSKPQVTVGVAGGGRWRAGTSFGGVVRCPNSSGLSAFTMPAHDYCTGPAPNAYVLPHRNETSWLRGVTLIANERHIDNFNHMNRSSALSPPPPLRPPSWSPPSARPTPSPPSFQGRAIRQPCAAPP